MEQPVKIPKESAAAPSSSTASASASKPVLELLVNGKLYNGEPLEDGADIEVTLANPEVLEAAEPAKIFTHGNKMLQSIQVYYYFDNSLTSEFHVRLY